jgi:YesN/AraC family two-component response regulator
MDQKSEVGDQRSEGRDQKSEAGEQMAEVSDQKSEGKDQKSDNEDSPLILIVEDDADVRDFIAEGLGSAFRVVVAKDGAAGLQIAKEQVPDLIVTDIMMPVMDGTALCRDLKTSLETSHIPVIMLTAKISLEHQIEGLKTGADDYITKPFHMKLLKVRIANLLESRRLLREKFRSENLFLTSQVVENTSEKEFMQALTDALDENYTDSLFGPEDFAAAMNMSRCTLQRKLKAVTNRTPADFINEFRMMKAAEILVKTDDTITEIGFDIGCDDSGNFARMFKKHYGMSPSKYRETHRNRLI